jgi:polysaccharide pyruvyl transferase WcaK-like protein
VLQTRSRQEKAVARALSAAGLEHYLPLVEQVKYYPSRHRCGLDMAFGLETREPARPLPERIESWLSADAGATVVGFNVSGLLFNHADTAGRRYGLRADYPRAVIRFLKRILRESDANILLVPHVFAEAGHREHDPDACASVAAAIKHLNEERVAILPSRYDPRETKWIISRTGWFCGARLHSTIAALSSGVPAAAVAYSPKAQGVFETCGQGSHVADLRQDTDAVVDRLWHSWSGREEARQSLRDRLPSVRRQVESQMDEIVARCAALRQRVTHRKRAA